MSESHKVSKSIKFKWLLLGCFFTLLLQLLLDLSYTSPKEALPSDANPIMEEYDKDILLPDYTYVLSAGVDEKGFQRFLEKMNMKTHKKEEMYYEEIIKEKDFKRTLKYENGTLTYSEQVW